MQCTYDGKGNSVPTILLLMQETLYVQGGLKVIIDDKLSFLTVMNLDFLILAFHFQAEGIFRINPENDQEEHVRDQLNRGVVPEDIDVHCLASLIKVGYLSA